MRSTIFFVLLLSSAFSFEFLSTVQEGFDNGDCYLDNLDTLNAELLREWNCHLPSNMRSAAGLPRIDWDPRAFPYLQAPMLEVLTRAMGYIESSNIADFLRNPATFPRWYFYRAYQPLPNVMAAAHNYAHGKCNTTVHSISAELLPRWEKGMAFTISGTHPDFLNEFAEWKSPEELTTLELGFPCDESMGCAAVNPKTHFSFYRPCIANPTIIDGVRLRCATIDAPYYDVTNKKLVFLSLQRNTVQYGYQSAAQMLYNLMLTMGVKYTMYVYPESATSILYPAKEMGVFPDPSPYLDVNIASISGQVRTWRTKPVWDQARPDFMHQPLITMYMQDTHYINQSINVPAFKNYWNTNNPTDLIPSPNSNLFDPETQTKLLLHTPPTGFGRVSCDPVCSPTKKKVLDIVFVLDASGSVTKKNFNREKEWLLTVAKSWPISQEEVRVGVVVFSSSVSSVIYLNEVNSYADLVAEINKIDYSGKKTWTGLAFSRARELLKDPAKGARGPLVPKVLVLVTDGKSNQAGNAAQLEAKLNRKKGINMIVIGVGWRGNENDELKEFACNGKGHGHSKSNKCNKGKGNVFTLPDFNLDALTKTIEQTTCDAPAVVPDDELIQFDETTWANELQKFQFVQPVDMSSILVVRADQTVRIYQTYSDGNPMVPSEYYYDLETVCEANTDCSIEVPVYRYKSISSYKREVLPEDDEGVHAGVAIRFESESDETVHYTVRRDVYDKTKISPRTPSVQFDMPILTEEDAMECEGSAKAVDPELEPEGETTETGSLGNGGVNLSAIFGGSAAVVAAALVVAVVVVRRRTAVENKVSTVMPFEGIVGGVIPTAQTPRSTVKRLNSVQYLNEMVAPN